MELLQGNLLVALLAVVIFGAFGGAANALLSNNRSLRPQTITAGGAEVWHPGGAATVFVGAFSALISYMLYDIAGVIIIGGTPVTLSVTAGTLAGSALIGFGGSRWLTNEADKKLLKGATVDALTKEPASDPKVSEVKSASPVGTVSIVQSL